MIDFSEQNNSEEEKKELSQEEKEELKKNKEKKYVATYVVFSQFVFEIIILIGGGIALGIYLDKLLNTKCLFIILAILLLGPVPFYNLIQRTRK
ncbi:MAG: hypothetical protein K6G38_05780 [Gammaproteobacteria bacterium]|nr:hypothetical protein [Gammaproteobacteria bacterium]